MQRPICPLCKLFYNDIQNIPKVLECGHSFCLSCCHQNQVHYTQLLCPIDYLLFLKQAQQLPNDTQLLQIVNDCNQQQQKTNILQQGFQQLKEKEIKDVKQAAKQELEKQKLQITSQVAEIQNQILSQMQLLMRQNIQKVQNQNQTLLQTLNFQKNQTTQNQLQVVTQIKFDIMNQNSKSSKEL